MSISTINNSDRGVVILSYQKQFVSRKDKSE
jgi:hypothetical protein